MGSCGVELVSVVLVLVLALVGGEGLVVAVVIVGVIIYD